MRSDGFGMESQDPGAGPAADAGILSDLRLRLRGREEQETAARAEARRLARELALARRLLAAGRSGPGPTPALARPPAVVPSSAPAAAEVVRQRAVLLTDVVLFHFDDCQNHRTFTALSGWAFRPAPGWDGRQTTVTLLLRTGATVYAAAAGRVPRPDVAAHFAAQSAGVTGGAVGLDWAGFRCEIVHDSLPAGVDLDITLRLEGAGLACEQATGSSLRL